MSRDRTGDKREREKELTENKGEHNDNLGRVVPGGVKRRAKRDRSERMGLQRKKEEKKGKTERGSGSGRNSQMPGKIISSNEKNRGETSSRTDVEPKPKRLLTHQRWEEGLGQTENWIAHHQRGQEMNPEEKSM